MEDKATATLIPLPILILGLICVIGFAIWSGSQFYLYNGGIGYGVAAGISIGAAYTFLKQINLHRATKKNQAK